MQQHGMAHKARNVILAHLVKVVGSTGRSFTSTTFTITADVELSPPWSVTTALNVNTLCLSKFGDAISDTTPAALIVKNDDADGPGPLIAHVSRVYDGLSTSVAFRALDPTWVPDTLFSATHSTTVAFATGASFTSTSRTVTVPLPTRRGDP